MQTDDLYQNIILDHFRHPRHSRNIPDGAAMVDEENPTCGDRIKLNIRVEGGCVADIEVDCRGCAICTASASIMADRVAGMPMAEVRRLSEGFVAMMRGGLELSKEELGDAIALRGVRRFPMRIKCATMPWHALDKALDRFQHL